MAHSAQDLLSQADQLCASLESTMSRIEASLASRDRLMIVEQVRRHANRDDLNDCCREAAERLQVAVCLVTLLDQHYQSFLGSAGLDPDAVDRGTTAQSSLCQFVVATGVPLQIDDALVYCAAVPADEFVKSGMHAYYGEPVRIRDQVIGSFCSLDPEPRHWTEGEKGVIRRWADVVSVKIEDSLSHVL